jgi:hypothetical protein
MSYSAQPHQDLIQPLKVCGYLLRQSFILLLTFKNLSHVTTYQWPFVSTDSVNRTLDYRVIEKLTLQEEFAWKWRAFDPSPTTTIKVVPYIEDALEYVRKLEAESVKEQKGEVHALITGSVHLVGRALGALEGVDAL